MGDPSPTSLQYLIHRQQILKHALTDITKQIGHQKEAISQLRQQIQEHRDMLKQVKQEPAI